MEPFYLFCCGIFGCLAWVVVVALIYPSAPHLRPRWQLRLKSAGATPVEVRFEAGGIVVQSKGAPLFFPIPAGTDRAFNQQDKYGENVTSNTAKAIGWQREVATL
jgi:hypothetical protein